jgi:hypothetical protein
LSQDPNYISYRKGRKIKPRVDEIITASGVDLTNGGGIPELETLQKYLSDYRIVVYSGLRCENIIFDGHTNSEKRLNLLYNFENKHCNVIVNYQVQWLRNTFVLDVGEEWHGTVEIHIIVNTLVQVCKGSTLSI